MKRILNCWVICCLLVLPMHRLQAQNIISIAGGGSMYVQTGVSVSFDSLTLTPSADLLLTENTIAKSQTVNHAITNGTYVSRVYSFLNPVTDYAGTVSITYQDNELNGLDENNLIVEAYQSESGWQNYNNNIYRNPGDNVVAISGTTGFSLDEITLASAGSVLPLQWISVEVTRQNSLTTINWVTAQEINCKYYQVQNSSDASTWQNVGSSLKANNSSGFNYYSLSDGALLNGTTYYRIMQIGTDGKTSYSAIVSAKDILQNTFTIYPNPATSLVIVRTNSNLTVRRIKVFDVNGKLIMTEEGNNSNIYPLNVSSLANGFYLMSVETGNDGKFSKGFIKQ